MHQKEDLVTKKVKFFYVSQIPTNNNASSLREKIYIPKKEWSHNFNKLSKKGLVQSFDDESINFQARYISSYETLGIHKILDPRLLTEVDEAHNQVRNFSPEFDNDTTRLANATAVVFKVIGGRLVFGICAGSQIGASNHSAVVNFINQAIKPANGYKWIAKPITVKGDIDKLKSSSGVTRFGFSTISDPNALPLEELNSIGNYDYVRESIKSISEEIGETTDVKIEISFHNGRKGSKDSLERLKKLALGLIKISRKDRKAEATILSDTKTEIIQLMEYKLAKAITLDLTDTTYYQGFDNLMSKVVESVEENIERIESSLFRDKNEN
ncbi:Uncharacterised protein [Rothia dentocariosa]|jgi:hypothetical protein|uniref:Uncharacterized protein n=1 Tax=Rothia dentocariosa TaxID=2047 RepID=A0A3S4YH67_9MICC|nr:Uncharacterised protein [Rothia dentocariosa]